MFLFLFNCMATWKNDLAWTSLLMTVRASILKDQHFKIHKTRADELNAQCIEIIQSVCSGPVPFHRNNRSCYHFFNNRLFILLVMHSVKGSLDCWTSIGIFTVTQDLWDRINRTIMRTYLKRNVFIGLC